MQVSIWSAFSSNHSSRFTVVGIFSTAEHAQRAAEDINNLLRPIIDWYNRPENADARYEWRSTNRPPSPPELTIAYDLDIPWSALSLDWLWFDAQGTGPVTVVENLVFISGHDSSLGAHPADDLIELVGGKALIDGSTGEDKHEYERVVLTLSCRAPDEATAEVIENEIKAYLRSRSGNRGGAFSALHQDYDGTLNFWYFKGKVRRAPRALIVTGEFSRIADGFPAMLAFLRARGCTNIQYVFTEKNIKVEE